MDEGDRDRPFAHGRRHALDVAARTSPTANTPGRLVSSRCGCRVSGHFAAAVCRQVGTVLMKPVASSTSRGRASPVRHGSVMTKTCLMLWVPTLPETLSRQRPFRLPVALEPDDFGPRVPAHGFSSMSNQIARHACETVRLRMYALGGLRQVRPPGRLSCRRPAPRLRRRRTVRLDGRRAMYARASNCDRFSGSGRRFPAGRNDHGARQHPRAVAI
jgi:hypothetical protein